MCCRQANEKEEMIIRTVKNLKLTDDEFKAMMWLSKWEVETVCNICAIIKKAKEYGRPLAEIRRNEQ
ncbi:hypothetical protein [Thermoanaerobacterium sp. R66]|uniref:hypothetical protein n=1 Tax=Thermoanaerobacterium sp. R66 TaxID=2742479 RepID=UPI002380591D|nr:hypothetical protein [Thermoanaerobacterium sp. R66]MDE4542291.1 hypothetical protein [Thermoanaerobacterium sp. R66]